MSTPFVHLHLHSEYSLVDSVVRIGPLIDAAVAAGMPAVALTDQSNLFAAVKFQRAALAAGVQPILGVDLLVEQPDDPEAPTRVVLLAQDPAGYLNLTALVSRSYIEGQHRGEPRIHKHWLAGHSDGLIALSGGRLGDVGRALLAGNEPHAEALLAEWQALFPGRYYLELMRTGRPGDEACVHASSPGRPVRISSR